MEHEKVPLSKTENLHEVEIPIVSEIIEVLPVPQKSPCSSVCAFSKKESSSWDSGQRSKSATKLGVLIIVYILFMVIEIVGGVKSNSLAVLTDAAHMFTDVSGFAISLFAVIASGWEATSDQSFGYHRLEVLSALLSVQLIWVVAAILIYEAVDRMLHEHGKINGVLMFAVAAFGFLVNLIMVMWLGHDHTHHHHHHHNHACGHFDHHDDHGHNHNQDHGKEEAWTTVGDDEMSLVSTPPVKSKISNINLEGAYLHVMADMIQSVGVMIAGAFIWAKPDWLVVDLICTLIFSVFAVSTTIPMLRNTYSILMQRTPNEIDIDKLEKGLKSIKGVQDVHDLHVWALTVGKLVLSCHITAEPTVISSQIIDEISELCDRTYRLRDVTVQIEQ
ncbi:metal tolerance protein B [Argentina anserina]|uniref:metal tolerance protein B n=1 Tax=Argentina anserina TaxID=57926 RepID=UPI0021765B15|nr:metal tolerance protein B [Potentilla anserina]